MPRKYILASNLETIESHFGAKTPNQLEWEPPILVSPGDESLVITQENPGEFTLSSFGMTPSSAKSRMQIINARAEGDKNPENNPEFRGSKAIFLKPAFQKPLFTRRCIVVADAFMDWSSGIFPKPHLFHLRDHKHPIGLAGLYDIWTNPVTRAQFHSFTIITVAANSLLRGIQSFRMPVILPYGQESRWLKPTLSLAEILSMLTITSSKQMNGYPLSSKTDQPGPIPKKFWFRRARNCFQRIIRHPCPDNHIMYIRRSLGIIHRLWGRWYGESSVDWHLICIWRVPKNRKVWFSINKDQNVPELADKVAHLNADAGVNVLRLRIV